MATARRAPRRPRAAQARRGRGRDPRAADARVPRQGRALRRRAAGACCRDRGTDRDRDRGRGSSLQGQGQGRPLRRGAAGAARALRSRACRGRLGRTASRRRPRPRRPEPPVCNASRTEPRAARPSPARPWRQEVIRVRPGWRASTIFEFARIHMSFTPQVATQVARLNIHRRAAQPPLPRRCMASRGRGLPVCAFGGDFKRACAQTRTRAPTSGPPPPARAPRPSRSSARSSRRGSSTARPTRGCRRCRGSCAVGCTQTR